MASGLDINGCVLSYFEGTANLHCYTSCTLTTLHCSKVSFKIKIKIIFYLSHTKLYREYITSSEMYSLHLTHPK